MIQAILLTSLAGIVGTEIGGLLGVKFYNKLSHNLSLLLAFSADMMIGMICFDLMPVLIYRRPSSQV